MAVSVPVSHTIHAIQNSIKPKKYFQYKVENPYKMRNQYLKKKSSVSVFTSIR